MTSAAGSTPSTNFDLESVFSDGPLRWAYRVQTSYRWALVGFGVSLSLLGIGAIVDWARTQPPPLWNPTTVFDALVAVLGVAVAYISWRRLSPLFAKRLGIDGTGVRLTYVDGSAQLLPWTNPELCVALVWGEGDPRLDGRQVYAIKDSRWKRPVFITEPALRAVAAESRRRGLVLREVRVSRGNAWRQALEYGSPTASLGPIVRHSGEEVTVLGP